MMRNWWKIFYGLSAVAIVAMAATTALAVGPDNLIENGDMETVSRFVGWGLPGEHSANGIPDAWHLSVNGSWSGPPEGPIEFVSPVRSTWLPDENLNSPDFDEEARSFATAIRGNPGKLDLSWMWKWDKTAGDLYSATVRISKNPVGGFDLAGPSTDYVFLSGGGALSAGGSGDWEPYTTSILLAPDDQSFDIIFATSDGTSPTPHLGMGTLWVDDVCATVPEPATMALLGLGGLGLMMASRRRCG